MLEVTVMATRTLTINPAFLQEIKDDNRNLHDLRIALRSLITNPLVLRSHLRRLVSLLEELRDRLAMHFSLEEAYGYFEDAIDVAPHLFEAADRLRQEHAQLFASLVSLADNAAESEANGFPPRLVDRIVDDFERFDARLSMHEDEETQLVFEVMDRDIGGEG